MAGAIAGTILEEPDPPNDNWRRCDGSYIANHQHNDYWRRVQWTHGGAWIGGLRLPSQPGAIIAVRDDPDYPPDPPPDPPPEEETEPAMRA
jgi:hypothetical protein